MRGIFNKTKNTLLAERFEICKSPWAKAQGLMFRKPAPLVFPFTDEKIISLHSWFVFGPIDLVFLNKKGIIVELKQGWRPFSFYRSKKKTSLLLELPAGTIARTKTEAGDVVRISE